jgi:hypothetical protein
MRRLGPKAIPMLDYLSNFYGGADQIQSLFATLVVWIGLSFIGRAVAGKGALVEASPFYGWAVVTVLFTLGGVFLAVPFTWLSIVIAVLAVGSAIYVRGRDGYLIPPIFLKLFVLSAPLWLVASAMVASQWDEFSHWLPSAQFLLDTDGFPDSGNKVTGASFPAYPYGWPILMYLSAKLAGGFLENAGALLNLFGLLTFGLVLITVIAEQSNDQSAERPSQGWVYAAVAALLVTAFNPTFVQKLVFTAYSETSTAVTIGLGGILTWMMMNALADGDEGRAKTVAWQAALALAVHINVRQANLVLFVVLLIALVLVGLRDRRIPVRKFLPLLTLVAVPAIVIYVTWRYHVAQHLSGAEFTIMALDKWHISLIPDILLAMIKVASKKGAYFGLILIVLALGIRAAIRLDSRFDRLSLIAALMFLGYNAFLFFSYLAAFGKFDALRAASYWRYNIHAGFFGIAVGVAGAGLLWNRWQVSHSTVWRQRLGYGAIAILLIAPIVLAKKIRFDHEGLKPHYQAVARDMKTLLTKDADYFIVDPAGNGEVGVITKYRIGRDHGFHGVFSAFRGTDIKKVEEWLNRSRPDYVLVHSLLPGLDALLGLPLEDHVSYLLKKEGTGWRQVKAWPVMS